MSERGSPPAPDGEPSPLGTLDREAWTRLIVDASLDAVIVIDDRGRVLLWNVQAEAAFGWRRDEALGRQMADLVIPPHLRAAHAAGMRHYLATGEATVLGRRFETEAQHRDGRQFPVELAVTPLRDGARVTFGAFLRDISERRRDERLLRAQHEISQVLAAERSESAAASRFLQATCQYLRWDVGALWTLEPGSRVLRCTQIWHEAGPAVAAFVGQTLTTALAPGAELPGTVLAGGEAAWWPDIASDPRFSRGAAARRGGLQAGVAVPIPVGGRAGGVAEFFSRTSARRDATELETLASLSAQLGQFIERTRTEAALETERAFLTRLLEAAPEAIVVLDPDDCVRLVNAEFTRLFGYEAAEVAGRPINALIVPPEEREHAEALTQRLIAGEVVGEEVVRQRKDGVRVEVSVLATPVRSQGRQIAMFAIYRDIGAHKRAERAVREGRQRLALALEGGDLGTWDCDVRTGLTTVSARSRAMLGHAASDAVLTIDEWRRQLHSDDEGATLAASGALLAGESPAFEAEYRMRHVSGGWVWVLDRARVTERDASGRPVRVSGTHSDITARKAAEQALRLSEARLASVIDHMLEGLVVLDEQLRIVRANPAFAAIFGQPLGRLRGMPIVDLVHAPAGEAPADAARRFLSGLGAVAEREGVRRDGQVFPLQLQVYEVVTGEGRLLAANVTDLTRQHEADRLKKRFIASVSHELRTPLTAIRGSLGLLALGALGDLPPDAHDLVRVAERNAVRLVGLVNDLLDIERIESGLLSITRRRFPLQRAVDRAIETVGPLAVESGIAILAASTPLEAWADEDRVVQVLVNLLGNAIKFSPHDTRVDVDAELDGHFVRVTVRDRGRGVPPALQEIIFHPFRQVEESDAREHGGSGVGLAICRALVRQHGGRIGVESAPGLGAAFWFTLPLRPDPEPAGADEATAPREPLH